MVSDERDDSMPPFLILIHDYFPNATSMSMFGRVTPGLPRKSAQVMKPCP